MLIGNGFGDFLLATHPSVTRYEAPGHLQGFGQFGNGGDLVGFAVISLDLSSALTWPSVRCCSEAHASTMCKGALSEAEPL